MLLSELKVVRVTGWFGLAAFGVFLAELVLRIIPGSPPQISDAVAHSRFLAEIRVYALTWVVLDMAMYVLLMIFFGGFRTLLVAAQRGYEWLATVALVAGGVWWAVSLVADGLQGAAVLHILGGKSDVAVVRTLVEATLLIYNGAIAFATTGLFMGLAGYAILVTRALPRWTGWLGVFGAVLCALSIPAIYASTVDHTSFYNAAGWGRMIVANVPPLVWFLGVSLAMVRMGQNSLPFGPDESAEL